MVPHDGGQDLLAALPHDLGKLGRADDQAPGIKTRRVPCLDQRYLLAVAFGDPKLARQCDPVPYSELLDWPGFGSAARSLDDGEKALLESLSRGAPGALITVQAQAAVRRSQK